jgi:hypothetical protein
MMANPENTRAIGNQSTFKFRKLAGCKRARAKSNPTYKVD